MTDGAFEDPTKAVLRPRNPGEEVKIKETVLKRRDRNLKAKQLNAEKIKAEKKKKVDKKKEGKLITPASLVKQSIVKRKDQSRLKRSFKTKKQKVAHESNGFVLLAIRNRRKRPTNVVKKILERLDLQEHNTLRFLPYNEHTCRELKMVKPFVYWGYPTFKTVNDLLHKKALFKTKTNEKVNLSSNALVEEHLGDSCGVLCVEDIVNTLFKNEDNFQMVNNRLWPIKLGDYTKATAEGFQPEFKKHHFGNLERKINDIVQEVL
ncbi:unnamed protein product [Amoebophrya sp. A120]|nr:unnamed protein product [Amoebophrya sp. A120]|eukprot:GSA120T00007327001.1